LRGKLKYGHEFKSAEEALSYARTQLHDWLDAEGLTLDVIQ
jgi:hypothetical protein